MQDQFGRTIEYLRLSVTDRCNLRCRYCMPEEGVAELAHGDVLRYEEMLRVVAAACRLGIRKIRVTGGEPLVRRGIVGFIGQLAALPEKPEITLTTNGLLLAEQAEDLKAAGFEAVDVRSGYRRAGGMYAYQEMKNDRVAFFIASLPRGSHNISYRLRAETPGKFSALPAKVYGNYAPELQGNSDEIKLQIED